MNLTDLTVATAVTIGMTEAFKRAFLIPDRFVPVVSLCVGIGMSLLFISVSRESALSGVFAALSASGLYSGGKTIAGY